MEDHRNKKHLKPQKLTISAALPSINRVKKIRCKATGQNILISANKASKQKIPKDQSRLSHPDSQEERSYLCSSRMKSIQRWVWAPRGKFACASPAASWCERGSALLQSEVSLCTYRHTCPCPVTSSPRLSAERPERRRRRWETLTDVLTSQRNYGWVKVSLKVSPGLQELLNPG